MADLSKFKRRLAAPPTPDQVPENLRAPETAPAPVLMRTAAGEGMPQVVRREDGRSAHKTGRTIQFATRVTEAFDTRFRAVAKRDKLKLSELLEKALEVYEER